MKGFHLVSLHPWTNAQQWELCFWRFVPLKAFSKCYLMALGKVCWIRTPTSGAASVSILKDSTSFKYNTSPLLPFIYNNGGLFNVWGSYSHDALYSLAVPVRTRSPCCWSLKTPNDNWQVHCNHHQLDLQHHIHGPAGVVSVKYQWHLALHLDPGLRGNVESLCIPINQFSQQCYGVSPLLLPWF